MILRSTRLCRPRCTGSLYRLVSYELDKQDDRLTGDRLIRLDDKFRIILLSHIPNLNLIPPRASQRTILIPTFLDRNIETQTRQRRRSQFSRSSRVPRDRLNGLRSVERSNGFAGESGEGKIPDFDRVVHSSRDDVSPFSAIGFALIRFEIVPPVHCEDRADMTVDSSCRSSARTTGQADVVADERSG